MKEALLDSMCSSLHRSYVGGHRKGKKGEKSHSKGLFICWFHLQPHNGIDTMRKFTKKAELIRHGVTRFATTFLTLQRLNSLKGPLRIMFTSDEWTKSKLAKDAKGKKATETVLSTSFWNDVVFSLKSMGPLVKVLRLVDNEKKPAMGYIYEAMDRAKEAIQNAFNNDVKKYEEVFEIIDRRWECQLHHPLHAAGHYLNPELYYKNPNIEHDAEVTLGLYKCIDKLSASQEEEDKITSELSTYSKGEGLFGLKAAIRHRVTMAPAEWWIGYGKHVPNLQKLAIKVLSLTCSSSGCERNWSTFEQIHSKKRNRLEHQKLQDLVFVKYNQQLKERYDAKDTIDPIVLTNIDDCCNEWMLGKMDGDEESAGDDVVFEGEDLTWGEVAIASGVNEPMVYTRSKTRSKNVDVGGSSSRGKEVVQPEDSEAEEEDEEEEELEYKSDKENGDNEEEDYLELEDEDNQDSDND